MEFKHLQLQQSSICVRRVMSGVLQCNIPKEIWLISIHPRTVVSHTTDVRLSTSPCPSTTQGNVKAYNLFQACVEAYNLV